jgi:dGTPase
MRLTCATLGAYLKYPWLSKTIEEQGDMPSHQRAKFGCYQSEKEILKQLLNSSA